MKQASKFSALLIALSGAASYAQVGQQPANSSDWRLSAGVAVLAAPEYLGADKTRLLLVPNFDVRYKDWFFANPIDGVGVMAKPAEGFTASLALGLSFDTRKLKDNANFAGLGDVKEAPALIAGLNYKNGNAFLNTKLSSRLGNANKRGTLLNTDIGYTFASGRWGAASAGLTARAMDGTYAKNFLGVGAEQSAASGISAYDAESGLQRAGLFIQSAYRVSEEWTAFGRLETTRLSSNAARSPLVATKSQASMVINLSRSF
jgi:MipA family protein